METSGNSLEGCHTNTFLDYLPDFLNVLVFIYFLTIVHFLAAKRNAIFRFQWFESFN